MSFQCSLLWAGLGWKVSSRKISHLGIPVHVQQEGSGALLAALKSSLASFVVPSSPFQRGAGNEGGQTSTKPEFCSFHSWIFSHKTKPNLSGTFGFTNNDQVCIFQMKLGLKTSSEPLLEGIFVSTPCCRFSPSPGLGTLVFSRIPNPADVFRVLL